MQTHSHEKLTISPVEMTMSKAPDSHYISTDLIVNENEKRQSIYSCWNAIDDHKIINEK